MKEQLMEGVAKTVIRETVKEMFGGRVDRFCKEARFPIVSLNCPEGLV